MDREVLTLRVVCRFAGVVIPFPGVAKPKTKIPTVTIGGVKYVLSTYGGPLGDLGEPGESREPEWSGGARVIRGPVSNPWKFLWSYDTDKQMVSMWRVTDGNNKVWGSATSEARDILLLDRKGQINRVGHGDFLKIEAAMLKVEKRYTAELERYIAENKSGFQKRVDVLVREYFEKVVEPRIIKSVGDIKAGAIPIGFKMNQNSVIPPDRQKISFVMGKIYDELFTLPKIHAYLKTQGIDMDDPQGDIQAAYWAQNEIWEEATGKYYPSLR